MAGTQQLVDVVCKASNADRVKLHLDFGAWPADALNAAVRQIAPAVFELSFNGLFMFTVNAS